MHASSLDRDELARLETRLPGFLATRLGFGNLNGTRWYIGLEEGGGKDLKEVSDKCSHWDGVSHLDDLDVSEGPWSKALQPTWKKLIRMHFALEGRVEFGNDDVLRFQQADLGRLDGDNALIELMPLPSPSAKDWNYSKLGFDQLLIGSRKEYTTRYRPIRIGLLGKLIEEMKPQSVVFYGKTALPQWKEIAQVEPIQIDLIPGFGFATKGETQFGFMPHPVSVAGQHNQTWSLAGEYMRAQLDVI